MQAATSGWRGGDAHDDAAVPEGLVMIDPRVYGACACASLGRTCPMMRDDGSEEPRVRRATHGATDAVRTAMLLVYFVRIIARGLFACTRVPGVAARDDANGSRRDCGVAERRRLRAVGTRYRRCAMPAQRDFGHVSVRLGPARDGGPLRR